MVVFMFDNKGCSWFPSNRVKDNLFNRMIVVNASSFDEIKEQGFTNAGFLKTVQAGSVDFGKSKKQGLDKVYRIDYENPKGKKEHCFMTMGDESFVTEIIFSSKKASKISPTNSDAELPGKILFILAGRQGRRKGPPGRRAGLRGRHHQGRQEEIPQARQRPEVQQLRPVPGQGG